MEDALCLQTYPPQNVRRKDTQPIFQYLLCSPTRVPSREMDLPARKLRLTQQLKPATGRRLARLQWVPSLSAKCTESPNPAAPSAPWVKGAWFLK